MMAHTVHRDVDTPRESCFYFIYFLVNRFAEPIDSPDLEKARPSRRPEMCHYLLPRLIFPPPPARSKHSTLSCVPVEKPKMSIPPRPRS
jgi:hypothetical protein